MNFDKLLINGDEVFIACPGCHDRHLPDAPVIGTSPDACDYCGAEASDFAPPRAELERESRDTPSCFASGLADWDR